MALNVTREVFIPAKVLEACEPTTQGEVVMRRQGSTVRIVTPQFDWQIDWNDFQEAYDLLDKG